MATFHHPRDRAIFTGFLGQHLPEDMTAEQMEHWKNHPEGLQAILAQLKSTLTAQLMTGPVAVEGGTVRVLTGAAVETMIPAARSAAVSDTIEASTLRSGAFGNLVPSVKVGAPFDEPLPTGTQATPGGARYDGDLESVAGQLA